MTNQLSKSVRYIAALALLLATPALADEEMRPLAEAGSWSAVAHSPSETAAPDICIAMSITGLGFRASSDGVELRITQPSWTLPAHVTGEIAVNVGEHRHVFQVGANTNSTIAAPLPPDAVATLLDEIASAPTMSVQVGKAKPITIALDGSKVVLTAFRTCADIGGGSAGDNPFKQ